MIIGLGKGGLGAIIVEGLDISNKIARDFMESQQIGSLEPLMTRTAEDIW